jgi:hypothetical protein
MAEAIVANYIAQSCWTLLLRFISFTFVPPRALMNQAAPMFRNWELVR